LDRLPGVKLLALTAAVAVLAVVLLAVVLLRGGHAAPPDHRPSPVGGDVLGVPSGGFVGGAFPTAADGWLLGQTDIPGPPGGRAEVLHTADGGASWQVQWRGLANAVSISAVDRRHAWALIRCVGPVTPQECRSSELIGTTDGGRAWHAIASLPFDAGNVRFVTDAVGVITEDRACPDVSAPARCPGQVLVSHDGGAAWAPVLARRNPLYATATASGTLYAAEVIPASGVKPSGPDPEVRFLTSGDGGAHWRTLGVLELLGPVSAATTVSLALSGDRLRWASVFDQESCAMHGCGTASVYQSADAGRIWALADLGGAVAGFAACGNHGVALSAAADGAAWAATGVNGGACSPPFGTLFRYARSRWVALAPWQLASVASLIAVDHEVAYAISGTGVLARTVDGGRHWVQLLPSPSPTGSLDALSARVALGAQDGVDAGAILRTVDGGLRWREVADLPGTIAWLSSAGSDLEYATTVTVTPVGRLSWRWWISGDAGRIWSEAGPLIAGPRVSNNGVYGPWLNADGRGLLLTVGGALAWQEPESGGNGPVRIWTTSDGGASWSRGPLLRLGSGVSSYIGDASLLVSPAGRWSGWTVGFNGLRNAIDAASSADPVARPIPGSPAVSDVRWLGGGVGFGWSYTGATGARQTVTLYATRDDGARWRRIRVAVAGSSDSQPLVSFADPDHGWIVDGASVLLTSDGGRTWHRPS
jgi:photosystem II stability/assembly factor-like uncharacterized protein